MLPSTSPTPRRSDAAIMADDLSQLAERINWPRLPELKEFEQMAETILSAGYYSSDELADTSSTDRRQLYKLLAEGRPSSWAPKLPQRKWKLRKLFRPRKLISLDLSKPIQL